MAKPKAMNIRRIGLDPPPPIILPKPPKKNILSILFQAIKRKLQAKSKGKGSTVVMDVNASMDDELEDYPDTDEDSFRTVRTVVDEDEFRYRF
jgi:hypothetical protein